jgi:hypothetical protein
LLLRGFYRRRCGEGVCGDCIDIDSLRKLPVELGIRQGWQAGKRSKEKDSFRIPPEAWNLPDGVGMDRDVGRFGRNSRESGVSAEIAFIDGNQEA